jgi:alpha-amylase/alpha-mannosidase (GH57 family)
VSGSWVYGTFSTWIGDKDKNRGWDMLGDAKKMFDEAVKENSLSGDQLLVAQHQLSICEGSDWF